MSSITFFFLFVVILALIFLIVNLILAPHNPVYWFGKSIIWEKLSNSGEALKLLILNYIWKYISGWSNYSGIVTSQKIIERAMGNRGSKSVIREGIAVKEQRVDGSWYGNKSPCLRYTLVGFERNYLIKIPSNQINFIRSYSKLHSKLNINPWYVTGFADGEGSFILTIIKDKKYKLGWRAACRFIISLHKRDLSLLQDYKNFFGVGNISFMGKESIQYRVESLEGLAIII
jgi:hypothetical protein